MNAPSGHGASQNQRRTSPKHKRRAQRNCHRDDRRQQRLHSAGLQSRLHRGLAHFLNSSCSRSCRPKALTTRIDSSPCCTTATMLLCCLRTSCVAFFTAFLNRETSNSMNGVTRHSDQVKSQLSQNMTTSMPTIVNISTTIPRVEDDAKF